MPTPAPLNLVVVSRHDSARVANLRPFADGAAAYSFMPSMVSVDPPNDRVYGMDAGPGSACGSFPPAAADPVPPGPRTYAFRRIRARVWVIVGRPTGAASHADRGGDRV
ncbi:hypothetical protein [Streptomyces sp. NPDC093225]|uniref:hypothetical protein n=1 Tax=Streptomyces sp. NPDC093225 TaxID=3366034 RepID=UPI00380952A3